MPKAILLALYLGFPILLFNPEQTVKQTQSEPVVLIDSIQGSQLFNAYCAVCHGREGKGDGSMAKALKTKPPDLSRLQLRNRGQFPAQRLAKNISGEEQKAKGHGSREMPIWGSIFSQVSRDQDLGRVRVDNLVKHIQSLQNK